MGKVIRSLLSFEDEADEVCLLAIYSTAEIFRLVYHINKNLDIQLARTDDIQFFNKDNSKSLFMLYHFDDQINYLDYYFVPNRVLAENLNKQKAHTLFEENSYFHSYLVAERRAVDYFLKIEGLDTCQSLIEKLNDIKLISAISVVDLKTLKSYKNLIFN